MSRFPQRNKPAGAVPAPTARYLSVRALENWEAPSIQNYTNDECQKLSAPLCLGATNVNTTAVVGAWWITHLRIPDYNQEIYFVLLILFDKNLKFVKKH
jgi:hypothetical protein